MPVEATFDSSPSFEIVWQGGRSLERLNVSSILNVTLLSINLIENALRNWRAARGNVKRWNEKRAMVLRWIEAGLL